MSKYEQPWYFNAKKLESETAILKLEVAKPNAPVAYSENVGYIEVPPIVVEYLSDPGAIGITGASFALDSNYKKGLLDKALDALYRNGLISNPRAVDAARLRISWVGKASEAATQIRSKK